MSRLSRGVAGSLFAVFLVGVPAVWLSPRCGGGLGGGILAAAFVEAVLATFCAIGDALSFLTGVRSRSPDVGRMTAESMLPLTALFSATASAAGVILLLSIRLIYLIGDAISLRAHATEHLAGFGPNGLWCFLLLFVCAGVYITLHRDNRLLTCMYVIAAAAAAWVSCLWPVFCAGAGGLQAGGASYLLVMLTASLLAGAAVCRRRARYQAVPGLHFPCGLQVVIVLIVVCFHAVVPVPVVWFGCRAAAAINALAALTTLWACTVFVGGAWHRLFVDAGLGLLIISLGSVAMTIAPKGGSPLVQRYPVLMNALMFGFSLALCLITWGFLLGARRRQEDGTKSLLGAIVPDLQRFAFLSGALALVAAGLMTVWPMMKIVAIADDTIGRVTAGFAAHLFLLLVMMICARRIKRAPFYILAVMTLASTIGFMLIRMYPYTAEFG